MNPQDKVALAIVVIIVTALSIRNWWAMEMAWRRAKKGEYHETHRR